MEREARLASENERPVAKRSAYLIDCRPKDMFEWGREVALIRLLISNKENIAQKSNRDSHTKNLKPATYILFSDMDRLGCCLLRVNGHIFSDQ